MSHNFDFPKFSNNLCDKLTMFERIKLYGIIFPGFNTSSVLKYSLSSSVILRGNLRQKWHSKRSFISHSYWIYIITIDEEDIMKIKGNIIMLFSPRWFNGLFSSEQDNYCVVCFHGWCLKCWELRSPHNLHKINYCSEDYGH